MYGKLQRRAAFLFQHYLIHKLLFIQVATPPPKDTKLLNFYSEGDWSAGDREGEGDAVQRQ